MDRHHSVAAGLAGGSDPTDATAGKPGCYRDLHQQVNRWLDTTL